MPLRDRVRVIGFVGLVAASSLVASIAGAAPRAVVSGPVPGTYTQVLALVAASSKISSLPADLTPSLQSVSSDFANLSLYNAGCEIGEAQTTAPACVFGDVNGKRTMVLYGDSHAEMWFNAFENVATSIGWRLVVLAKPYCPPASLTFASPLTHGAYFQCTQWQRFAIARIRSLRPSLVVITGELDEAAPGITMTPALWQQANAKTLQLARSPGTQVAILGNIANIGVSGPTCLARHPHNVQSCSLAYAKLDQTYYRAEQAAAQQVGGRYINVLPWLCATVCSPVVGKFDVYFNQYHITATYATYLSQVLHIALVQSIKAANSNLTS